MVGPADDQGRRRLQLVELMGHRLGFDHVGQTRLGVSNHPAVVLILARQRVHPAIVSGPPVAVIVIL